MGKAIIRLLQVIGFGCVILLAFIKMQPEHACLAVSTFMLLWDIRDDIREMKGDE